MFSSLKTLSSLNPFAQCQLHCDSDWTLNMILKIDINCVWKLYLVIVYELLVGPQERPSDIFVVDMQDQFQGSRTFKEQYKLRTLYEMTCLFLSHTPFSPTTVSLTS